MRLILDTFVRWLITAAVYLGAIAYFRAPEAINFGFGSLNTGMAAVIIAAMVLMSAVALEGADRCLFLLSCCDSDYVEKCIRDLDSPTLWRKRLALRTLTDYLGGNIGIVGPFDWCGSAELEAHAVIVKKLWVARQSMAADCPSQEQLLPATGAKYEKLLLAAGPVPHRLDGFANWGILRAKRGFSGR